MNSVSIALSFLLSLLGLGVAAFAYRFLRVLRENMDQAMASFQLHPDETVQEFRLLFFGLAFELAAFIVYGVGGLLDLMVLLNVARAMSALFILICIRISLQWWRRFT
jgi:hypothetical protein